MKEFLVVVSLLLSGVVSEPPAPYAPSGWRPNGPAFDLPQRPQSLPPQKQEYLPPVDPRRPFRPDNFDDNVDVSVQGLPVVEQQPIFELSPINGQQLTGPSINADISRLNPSFQQAQYQLQQEKARQFERQRQFDTQRANIPSNGLPNQQPPIQFASQATTTTTTTTTTTSKPEFKTMKPETTTKSDLNEGEENPKDQSEKVSVEVSKQNVQEYPAEIFLRPLSQLNLQPQLQPQFVPLNQFGQLKAPIYYQVQPGPQGFNGPAHLSALPSVLAQRELLSQQQKLQNPGFAQNPIVVPQEQPTLIQEPLNQYQPIISQYQPIQPQEQPLPQPVVLPPQTLNQLQPQPNQYPQQPNQFAQQPDQFAPQPNIFVQQPNQFAQQPEQFGQQSSLFVPQPDQFGRQPNQPKDVEQSNIFVQQPNQFAQQPVQFGQQPSLFVQQSDQFAQQPNQFPQQSNQPKDVEQIEQNDQQVVYQNYQPQFYQPVNQYQQPEQPLFLAQPSLNQNQFYQTPLIQQYDPNQSQPQVYQDQNALQSGLDIDQGNGLDQAEDQEDLDDQNDDGSKATAVATVFGARTQPRVFAQYGAPIPKVQAAPEYPTTTEAAAQDEAESEEGPAIAQAVAVATGRRNAKLRSRRVRPVFTLDRSGHLVLAQQ